MLSDIECCLHGIGCTVVSPVVYAVGCLSSVFHLIVDFEEAVTQAKDVKVEITVFKVVLLGPPEAGKTQLVSALLGDYRPVKYSTPLSTKAKVAVTRFVINNDSESVRWELLTKDVFQQRLFRSANDEAMALENEPELLPKEYTHPGPNQASMVPALGNVTSREEYPRRIVDSDNHPTPKPSQASDVRLRAESEGFPKSSYTIKDDFAELLKDVNKRCSAFDKTQTLEVRYVHLIDNGGQPAFFDAHPVFATSQATYLLVYNMQEGLDAKPKYTYRKRGHSKKTIPNDHYTNLDLLQASLQTVGNLREKFCLMDKKMLNDSKVHAFSFKPTDSYVLVVGTRYGVPTGEGAATVVADWNKELSTAHSKLESSCKSVCSEWVYVQRCKMRCLFPVDSLNQDCEGVQAVREKVTPSDFGGMKLSMSIKWFHCHLLFWHAKEEKKESGEKMYPQLEVLLFSELLDLCKEHELVSDKEELLAMVRAFHVLGLFFFPALEQEEEEGPEWKPDDKPVFTNPDLLFGELTKILEIAFEEDFPGGSPTGEDPKLFSQLKDYGEITPKIMDRLRIPDKLDAIPDFHRYLLEQLSTWGLAAELPASILQDSSGPVYFVPCVLQPLQQQRDNPRPTDDCASDRVPLCMFLTLIYDECSYYIPNGSFTHFVVNLLRQSDKYRRQKERYGVQHCYSDCVDLVRCASDSPQQIKYGYNLRIATCKLKCVTVSITPRHEDQSQKCTRDYYQIIWKELCAAMTEACQQMFHKKVLHEITVATKCRCKDSMSYPHLAKLRIDKMDMECLRDSGPQKVDDKFLLEVMKACNGELQ